METIRTIAQLLQTHREATNEGRISMLQAARQSGRARLHRVLWLVIATLAAVVPSTPVFADVTCIKRSIRVQNGQVNIARNIRRVDQFTCPRNFTELVTEDNALAGFVHLNSTGRVESFGGSRTRTVFSSVSSTNGASYFDVTFTGNFNTLEATDSLANRNKVSPLSNAISTNYNVTNVEVTFASSLQITVRAHIWPSDNPNLGGLGRGIHLAILLH